MDRTKRCPHCGSTILTAGIRCSHCGERLDGRDADPNVKMYENKDMKRLSGFYRKQPLVAAFFIICIVAMSCIAGAWIKTNTGRDADGYLALTGEPWVTRKAFNSSQVDNGLVCTMDGTLDRRKKYLTNRKYLEEDTLHVRVACSDAYSKWMTEGEIGMTESGSVTGYVPGTAIKEKAISVRGSILSIRIVYNNSGVSDEGVRLIVKSLFDDIISASRLSCGENTYGIKALSDITLVLETDVPGGSGQRICFERQHRQ